MELFVLLQLDAKPMLILFSGELVVECFWTCHKVLNV